MKISLTFTLLLLAMLAVAGCERSPEQRLARATAQFANGDYALASIELRNVLQKAPENLEARLLLGLTAQRLGDLPGAEDNLNRARALGAPPQDYALPLAQVLIQLRRGTAALAVLEDLDTDARDADWHAMRGNAHAVADQREAARRAYDQALALQPDHYEATLGLAELAAAENDFVTALRLAERASELAPTRSAAWQFIGSLQLRSGNLTAAGEAFRRAADLEAATSATTQELNALLALAQVQLALNDIEALRDTRARLQARAPEAPITQYVAAAVEHLQGNFREADLLLTQIAEVAQGNLQIQLLVGANSLALGTYTQAEQALLRVLGLQPGQPNAVRLLAETRRRQGRPRAALEALRALAEDGDPQVLALRGILSLEDSQVAAAIGYLEQALAAAPRQPAIQLQLARAYLAADRSVDAVALFDGPIGLGAERAIETAVTLLSAYAADQDLPAARAAAARLETSQPQDAQVAMGLALFHQALGESAEAVARLQRSLQLDPDLLPARLTLAGLELANGNAEQARAQYAATLQRNARNVPALLGLAQIATQAGASDEAAGHLAAAIAAEPANVAPHLALARLELNRDDLPAARRVIDAAAQRHPQDAEIATFQGLVRFREGQGEAAVGAFRRASEQDPERSERWLNLGRAEAAAGNPLGARESLLRARRLQPRSAPVLLTLAQVELELGNLAAARETAQALQAAAPRAAQGYLLEGDVSSREGDQRDADRLYVSAFERQAQFDSAFRSYQARRQAGLGEPAQLLTRWLQVSPEDTRARMILAQQLQSDGRGAAAILEYAELLRREPDNVVALNNAAWLLGEQGDYEQGIEYARRAAGLAPDAAPVLDTYGWLLVQSGRVAAGLEYLEQAVRRAPAAPDLHFHLGSAQARAGQNQAAAVTLRRLLAEHPQYPRRDEVQRLLEGL